MSNRWLRFVIALVALAAAGAAGYRIFQQEQQLAADTATTRAGDLAGETAIATISEIKAALHAYVAAGQGQAFWTARAGMLLDKLRGSVLELDGVASGAGAPLTETLDLSDRLAASEQRARDHVRAGQALLAGEVIFTESRDLLDAIRIQSARARSHITQAAHARQSAIRREQLLLALGAGGILALVILILVPPGRATDGAPTGVTSASETQSRAPDDGAEEYARVIANSATLAPAHRTAPSAPDAPVAPVAPALTEAAAICTAIARVSDSLEISALLGRAAAVLNASGIIVWMASEDRSELFPAASAGYDERLFARLGTIPRAESNLTAAAFREGVSRTSAGQGTAAAALAVPLLTPQGSVGVFSAELRERPEVDAQQLAIATIFAAQLSMLLGSMSTAEAGAQGDAAAR